MPNRRLTLLSALAGGLLLVGGLAVPALAHGPTPQRTDGEVTIEAPRDEVWAILSDFGSIGDWHPDVQAVELADDGEARTLTLPGGTITETLDVASDERGVVAWRMGDPNPDALPVSSYNDRLTVTAEGDERTTVRWIGRFYRADTSNFPAEGQTDEAAVEAMSAHVDAGLEGLKAYVEGGGES